MGVAHLKIQLWFCPSWSSAKSTQQSAALSPWGVWGMLSISPLLSPKRGQVPVPWLHLSLPASQRTPKSLRMVLEVSGRFPVDKDTRDWPVASRIWFESLRLSPLCPFLLAGGQNAILGTKPSWRQGVKVSLGQKEGRV